jgi:probable rRNA maturation factor
MPESNTPDSKPPDASNREIGVSNQTQREIPLENIRRAIALVLDEIKLQRCQISVAVVDDPTMHDLNRRYLEHDYPTDVLSFPLERDLSAGVLVGEIVVSIDTAQSNADDYQWPLEHELLLYVIHGCLHLIGYDDHDVDDQQRMRQAESRVLRALGLSPGNGSDTSDHLNRQEQK